MLLPTKPKKLLILDLDNCVYDWATYFVYGITAQAEYLAKHTNVHPSVVYAAFSEAHKELGCTEHPDAVFLVAARLDMSLSPWQARRLAVAARERFISAAIPHLKLYTGVRDVITSLPKGWEVAICTDALRPNAELRLQLTHLSDLAGGRLSAIDDDSVEADHKPSPSRLLRIA